MSSYSPYSVVKQLVALNGGNIHFHLVGYTPDMLDDPDREPLFGVEVTVPGVRSGGDLDEAAWFFGNLLVSHVARAYQTRKVPEDIIWEAHTLVGLNMN